jgi:hypothetical protein
MTKVKRKPPSRIKYEQGHPTISCRVPRKIYEKMQAIKEKEGRSFADILKAGLRMLEVRAIEKEELRKRSHAEGYRKGYAEAEQLYKVAYPCSICGRVLVVTTGDEKEAASEYMEDHGWGHAKCHKKRQQGYL